ncbi:hypothetical protein N866_03280 [Actinotalea ferrariae CF5-4]|uniref:ParB-like N-terminal domain-containing protein n=1 Tax=Actinotalea ferrariae CF5-4 TaxID=948458 RepID=A0A021VUN1_9CELL|nr:ParB/RepB/Spo0J family partition protein [Actinotalea ferrariae]EYR64879.1 hypothetical protein N866_03280 [Actinotalea ferrariae CF5-4]
MKAAVVPVADLALHPSRIRADLGNLDELTASVRTVGLLQPLLVTARPGKKAVVIDGVRRLTALTRAGIDRALCLVLEPGDASRDMATMLAAAMHKELEPLEQADAFAALRHRGMTQQQIARATGYSTRTVGSRLILANLPEESRAQVTARKLTLADAEDLARQLRGGVRASTRATSTVKARWLGKSHPLAKKVSDGCGHGGHRVMIGGVGCGQCWESAIRDDAVAQVIYHGAQAA